MTRLAPFIALFAALSLHAAPPEAALYDERCSGCHTVGGGDGAGPDLIASTRWPDAELRTAIKRMEDNVGPLSEQEVDLLVAFLRKPRAATPVERPKGIAEHGRKLFFGQAQLANGGSPCFACHTVGGEGGSLAADLTTIHERRSATALMASTAKPGFPMMKAAYAKRPVTDEEALHLVAFLEAAAPVRAQGTTPFGVAAVSFAGLALGAVAFVFRARKAGVRARLVRKG